MLPPPPPSRPPRRARAGTAVALALALTLAPAATGPALAAGGAYFPGVRHPGYDARHYDLRLRVDRHRKAIRARAAMTAVARRRLARIRMDFVGLHVDAVTVDGRTARTRRHRGRLTVTPREPVRRGDRFVVAVRYHGVPRRVPDPTEADPSDGIPLGWTRRADGDVYVVSEPTGARGWFPCHDHPADKASFRVAVDAPAGVAVAGNGRLRRGRIEGGRRVWRWTMAAPMATYLATVVIAPMREHRTTSAAGVPIRSFFPVDGFDRAVRDFARTGDMLDFFATRFGPYPFAEYGVVTVDADLGYALENQTMSVFGRDMLGTDTEAQLVVAHELAHQWFGDSVGIRRWPDIWLNEGFAEYAQYLWRAEADPTFDLDAAMAAARAEHADGWRPIGDPGPAHVFGPAVYQRGALTLHALRRTVGDDAFFTILRTWASEHRHATATTAGFVRLAERVSGRDLGGFFAAWLDAPTVPPLPR